jgi:5-methylcytosine-specific restriction endonuclease McrA
MFRDFKKDQLKSPAEIFKAAKMKCVNCGEPVTKYKGPGDSTLCRKHQKNLVEYGGTGKVGVDHSHSRGKVCVCCGYDPQADQAIIDAANGDAVVLNQILRKLIHVDHIDGDHENNDPSNHQTLCYKCHAIKTILNKDYLPKSLRPGYLAEEFDE